MRARGEPGSYGNAADRVGSILASRQLTLYQASLRSATLFGRSSPYYLPHNLYYDLRRAGFTPSLFQLFALSRISDYRLTDWLRVFGFEIEAIPHLQIQLPSRRTIPLDSSLDDPNALIRWLRDLRGYSLPAGIVPLSQLLEWTTPRRLGSLAELYGRGFLYARIGDQDALAFPELLAGSIVRIRPATKEEILQQTESEGTKNLVLIEHSKGLCCCRIRVAENGRIAPVSALLPYREVAFKVPEEVNIVGVADLEIRSLLRLQQPGIANELANRWKPEILSPEPSQLGPLLRRARLRMGLSFRAASAISRQIADSLGDERYSIAASSLSDYETFKIPPRHFHKVVTFCAAYALRLNMILETLGLRLEEAGHEPMPDTLAGRSLPVFDAAADPDEVEHTGFIGQLTAELGEIPFFFRGSLKVICGLSRPSLKDFFWIGGAGRAVHPYLAGGLIAVVNRQKKKPNDCGSKPLWQQPLYVILKRDGTYLCGCCSRENNSLVVHSYLGGVHRREQFRNRDAEVVGKIVTIVRRL